MRGPDQLIDPYACRNCGEARPHGWRWSDANGYHQWEPPTDGQLKARMVRRRRRYADTRWVGVRDPRTTWRKWRS